MPPAKKKSAAAKNRVAKADAANRRAVDLLMQLLSLPGPSGGEQHVGAFLTAQFTRFDLPGKAIVTDRAFQKSPLGGQMGNLALRLPGTIKGPRRLFSAHMDTVPLCGGAVPVQRGRRIVAESISTALGGDDRTGCAVLLATALAILEGDLPHPPLTFLWTVQEEVGLQGAHHLRTAMLKRPQLAFNFDGPEGSRITIGATGGYRMQAIVEGVAAHAGIRPECGVSAIAIASLAIADLVRNGWHGQVEKGSRQGTSNVGVIRGGSATNVVTDRVELRIEARSHDPTFRARIVREIERALHKAAAGLRSVDGAHGRITIDGHLDYESFKLSRTEPCVKEAVGAIKAEGIEPEYSIANGGLDANWLTHHGIPSVTLGCGQHNIHTVDEYIEIDEFKAACRIALRLATLAVD